MGRTRSHIVLAVALAVLSAGVLGAAVLNPAVRDALLRAAAPTRPSPSATASPEPSASPCPVSDKLVPECGAWWGVAPGVFTDTPSPEALADFEAKTHRRADIYHRYHRGDELFPTAEEIAVARDPEGKRALLLNWKVAWGATWADVAAGRQDKRIDRLAEHINDTFSEPFLLAIHHEPENDVKPEAGSGMTAKDYAAMFRHTAERLRAKGVDNAIFVMVHMGYEGWGVKPWFEDLYPGDDVVDWIGFDPYVTADPDARHYGDFSRLVNMTSDEERWPGFYNWAVETHPGKPLMLAEWGVFEHPDDIASKARIFSSARRQVTDFPAIKAMVYFDSPRAPRGDTRVDSSEQALAEFRNLAELSLFSILFPAFGPPSVSPSASPSSAPTSSPSGSPSPGATVSPTASDSASPSESPQDPPSPSDSASASPSPSDSASPTAGVRERRPE